VLKSETRVAVPPLSDPSGTTDFDLGEVADAAYSEKGRDRIVVTVVVIWFAAVETYLVWQRRGWVFALTHPNGGSPALLFGGILVIIGMCIAFQLLDFAAHAPISVALTDMGIDFRFSKRSPRLYAWNDPLLRLNLLELSPTSRSFDGLTRRPDRAVHYYVQAIRPRYWPLTATAFESIMTECRRRGVRVTEHPRSAGRYPITAYRVRPAR
jgi:hypothetical protein